MPLRCRLALCLLALWAPAGTNAQSKEDLFKQVFGNKAATERNIEAELVVDGVSRDPVSIRIAGKQLIAADLPQLRERLLELLDDTTAACLEAPAEEPLKHAAECGIALRYDAAALKLLAEVPANLRREQALGVRPTPSARAPTAGEARLSGFLNLSASARWQTSGAQDLHSEALGLDGALRWRGTTLEFDGVCASGDCAPGLRSLVIDQTRNVRRWRLGDLPDARASGLSLPGLRGVSVGTAFELAPAQSYTPDLDAPLELNAPATVEVLVNQRTVQRFQLPAGRYSVRDFPLAFGANAAELRITDAAGRVETRQLEAFVDLSLLDEGRSRFAIALGQPAIALDLDGRSARPWTVAAEYASGVGPRTTVGYALASMPDLQRHVGEIMLTQAIGRWLVAAQLGCSAGLSQGCLAGLRFRRGGDPRAARPGWRLEGALSMRQADYLDLLSPEAGGGRSQVLLRAARSLSERYSLALGLRAGRSDHAQTDALLSAQLGGRLGRNFSFRIGVERFHASGQPHDTRFTASLSLLFDRASQSLQWDADSLDALQSARWQLNRGGQRGGYSATLGGSRSELGDTADASGSYRHERFGVDLSLGESMPAVGTGARDTRLTVRSALVYADGHVGLTERVVGAFGVVVPSDPNAAGTVYVNPVDEDYIASSRGPGPAVVPNLRAYEARSLVLSLPDLAAGHDPGPLFPVVLPGYKGGVVIPAGGAATVSLGARLLDAEGQPLELVSGQLAPADGGEALPVFAGRGGRLRANGLRAGTWTLILNARPQQRQTLVIPADAHGLIELGDLRP